MKLAIAIPVFNEAEGVPELVTRVRSVIDQIPGGPHQVVIIDDGSTDNTARVLEEWVGYDDRFTIVVLSRNFGHQIAVSAALEYVTADAVMIMDGDLQDPPEAVELFLQYYKQGYDVVYGVRTKRKEPFLLRACYFLFYRAIVSLSEVNLPLDAGDFALLSKRVVNGLRSCPERHRYVRGLRAWVGYRQIGVEVERGRRRAGESKYNFPKLLKLAFDGIFSFSVVPLRMAIIFGAVNIFLAFLYGLYAIVVRLAYNESPQGFTMVVSITVLLSGSLMLCLGIIGEYIGRIYEEVKGRPHFMIDRIIGKKTRCEVAPPGSYLRAI